MTDEKFQALCNTYGFAPSRALRELLDTVTAQAAIYEREACAKVCDELRDEDGYEAWNTECAAAIRARSKA